MKDKKFNLIVESILEAHEKQPKPTEKIAQSVIIETDEELGKLVSELSKKGLAHKIQKLKTGQYLVVFVEERAKYFKSYAPQLVSSAQFIRGRIDKVNEELGLNLKFKLWNEK